MGEPIDLEGCISMGPWGGPGGDNEWSFSVKCGITQIVIVHGDAIDSITFKGDNGNNVMEESEKFGGNGGSKTDKIDLDWPKEYLTGISGSYGIFYSRGPVAITSLCFITNHRRYGPFGINNGATFSIPMEGGAIVGFHGRAGQYIDAIGVYAKPGEPCSLERFISMGPWGGPGGNKWSFSVKRGIKQIVIVHGDAIDSLIFKGDNGYGVMEESKKFGGNGGSKNDTIDIDWPNEYLTGISGSYGSFFLGGPVTITSLCFITNHTIYGPFGINKGASFSIPLEGSAIVGFHGRADQYIDAIGVYAKPGEPSSLEGYISMGPWGGPGGDNEWSFSVNGGIKQIVIVHGDVVDSIIFKGDNGNGLMEDSEKFGGNGGSKTDKTDIDWPMEYLTSISGSYASFYSGGPVVITSLCFDTNRTKYGPFGSNSGTSFSIRMEGGAIVGFHGRAGHWLDAIGVYARPIKLGVQNE